jgi:error-prone DNA polymerase
MGAHPLALLRERLTGLGVHPASTLARIAHGRTVTAAGLVTHRQRPETARGTVFITLEDETGTINLIVWPDVFERQRNALLRARLLRASGLWQRDVATGGQVRHLIVREAFDDSALLGQLAAPSRDFR